MSLLESEWVLFSSAGWKYCLTSCSGKKCQEKCWMTSNCVPATNSEAVNTVYPHYYISVQFSPSVLSDSLQLHGLQHARLPFPSPTSGACSNSCPSSRGCHPTISSVVPFSSCLKSFLASGSCPMSQFFTSGPKVFSIFSISTSNEYSGLISLRIDWLDFLAVQGTLKSLLQHHSSKASILQHSAFFIV